jgi:hypothetical protein
MGAAILQKFPLLSCLWLRTDQPPRWPPSCNPTACLNRHPNQKTKVLTPCPSGRTINPPPTYRRARLHERMPPQIQAPRPPPGNRGGGRMCVRCGAVPEDTEHVLLHCPLTHHQRCHFLPMQGPLDSLRKGFDHPPRCLGLLRFLEATRVCIKPRTVWEPG